MQGIDVGPAGTAAEICRRAARAGLIIESAGPHDEVVKVLAPLTTPETLLAPRPGHPRRGRRRGRLDAARWRHDRQQRHDLPAGAGPPGADARRRLLRLADLVLTSDDVDQSVRWTPGERLHHLFEQRCDDVPGRRRPGHLAVARGPLALTYDELDARANRLARYLRAHGVRPGDRVGLVFDDAAATPTSACWPRSRCNAAYVPLDAAFPPDRLAYIVRRRPGRAPCSPSSALRDRLAAPRRRRCSASTRRRAEIDRLDPGPARPGRAGRAGRGPLLHHLHLRHHRPAQGRGHRARRASATSSGSPPRSTACDPDDRMYQGMTIAFDFSVEEIWVPLVAGATLVPKPGRNLLGEELAEYLRGRAGDRAVLRADAARHHGRRPCPSCGSCWSPARPARRTWWPAGTGRAGASSTSTARPRPRSPRPGPTCTRTAGDHRGAAAHLLGGDPRRATSQRRAAARRAGRDRDRRGRACPPATSTATT